jgi:hypothetical protein
MKYPIVFLAVLTAVLFSFAACNPDPDIAIEDLILDDPVRENPWPDTWVTITNDSFWFDTENNPLFSQSGGIFDFIDPETGKLKHYWYGIRYRGAEEYNNNPNQTSASGTAFVSVPCYSSGDLVNWKFEGNMLSSATEGINFSTTNPGDPNYGPYVGRMGAAYLPEIRKYLLVLQHGEGVTINTDMNYALIVWADSPTGPFTYHRHIGPLLTDLGTYTGDQTVFADDDGSYYLVYSKGNTNTGNIQGNGPREKIYAAKIAWDAENQQVFFANPKNPENPKDFTNPPLIAKSALEGNCMFKYEGKYYNTGSLLYGWNASLARYQVADGSIVGVYRPGEDAFYTMLGSEKDYSHISQTGFYYLLEGTKQNTVIFCGDRWSDFCSNGIGYNQWVPLTIDAAGDVITFNSLSQWQLNPRTGEWRVAEGNNYVLNGTFEADRMTLSIGSVVTGWNYSGTTSIGTTSTVTNVVAGDGNGTGTGANTTRPGKGQMRIIGNTAPVTAGFSQNITLPDGSYTLKAEVMRANTINTAAVVELYAGTQTYDLKGIGTSWEWVTLTPVTVTGGQITVGVRAEELPNNGQLNVDNISLVLASYTGP